MSAQIHDDSFYFDGADIPEPDSPPPSIFTLLEQAREAEQEDRDDLVAMFLTDPLGFEIETGTVINDRLMLVAGEPDFPEVEPGPETVIRFRNPRKDVRSRRRFNWALHQGIGMQRPHRGRPCTASTVRHSLEVMAIEADEVRQELEEFLWD